MYLSLFQDPLNINTSFAKHTSNHSRVSVHSVIEVLENYMLIFNYPNEPIARANVTLV